MHRFILFFLVFTLFLGCDSDDNGDNGTDEYLLEDVESRGWSAIGINEMTAGTVNGEITYYAIFSDTIIAEITRSCTGEDQLEAEVCIDSVVVTDSTSGDHLYLAADMSGTGDHNYRADFDIVSPGSITVDLTTVNGSISVNNMIAGADIHTVNGNLTCEDLQGNFSGQSVNGSIDCALNTLEVGEWAVLQTVNGNIILSLPSNVPMAFYASTAIGMVTITGFPNISYTTNEPNNKVGFIGQGSVLVNISVVVGNITIQAQ